MILRKLYFVYDPISFARFFSGHIANIVEILQKFNKVGTGFLLKIATAILHLSSSRIIPGETSSKVSWHLMKNQPKSYNKMLWRSLAILEVSLMLTQRMSTGICS